MEFDEFEEALDRQVALREAASFGILTLIGQELEGAGWELDGATSMSGWLCARYEITSGTAHEWVRMAKALRELPMIAQAYAQGRLTWDQLRPLTHFATPETDQAWAERAAELSPGRLWLEKSRQETLRKRQAQSDHELRRLWMSWDEGRRWLELNGSIPGEQGAAVEAALRKRAREITLDEGPVDDPGAARLADALTELCTQETGASPNATLVVHADAEVVAAAPATGRMRMAETESGIRLAEEAVRRMACEANVEWVLESRGRPVGVGRKTRSIPPHISRLLRHRDRGCRFPGCGNGRWLKAHHIWHWGNGGPTDVANLVLLCHGHHRLLHEGGWSVRGDPSGRLRFHDPTGRERPRRRSPSRAREPAARLAS